MLTRRIFLLSGATLLAATGLALAPARAQSPEQASAFLADVTRRLTDVVNSTLPNQQKQLALQKIIDADVDVPGVARFCLGRFWNAATPQQQKEYSELFRRVLMINITGKVGDYQGVSVVLGRAAPREGEVSISSIVNRPGNQPSKVDWIIGYQNGAPKIIDVVAEGTSLRLTQRSDYLAYLSHNNNSIQALIEAMRQQVNQSI